MSTSNQLSVNFRRVRQISRSGSANEISTRKANTEPTARDSTGLGPIAVVGPRNSAGHNPQRRKRLYKIFGIVLTPVLLAAFYVFAIATPMYVSETRFAVRGGESRTGGALSGLLSSNSPLAGMVDGYSVRDFLQSAEAMDKLDQSVGFVSRIARSDADPLVRLSPQATHDQLYRTYKSFVQTQFNMVEQIVVVRVFAFSPEDAATLAKALSALAEKFSADINKRSREDALALSEAEVERYDVRVRDARLALNNWRSRNANIDPTANVTMINTLIASLETTLAENRSQLAVLNLAAQDNPNRRNLEQRIGITREQIAEAKRRLTGTDSKSEAAQLTEYERLKIDLEAAEKARESARSSLDDSRVQLIRQQKYVFTVAAPTRPDTAEWPGSVRFLGGGLVLGLVLLVGISLGTGMLRDAFA